LRTVHCGTIMGQSLSNMDEVGCCCAAEKRHSAKEWLVDDDISIATTEASSLDQRNRTHPPRLPSALHSPVQGLAKIEMSEDHVFRASHLRLQGSQRYTRDAAAKGATLSTPESPPSSMTVVTRTG
jgi:hypothetical protein